jgi:predicted RNase H-like HicB family nuclease
MGMAVKKPTEHPGSKLLSYTVQYEESDGGYVAFVPALPGCHTQGETLDEAEAHAKEAILAYIESLEARGEPIPEEGRSFQGRVTVPVSIPA